MRWITFIEEDPNELYQKGETHYLCEEAVDKYIDQGNAVIHAWECPSCSEKPIEQKKEPIVCPNPNCGWKGKFISIHPTDHDKVAQAIYQNIPFVATNDDEKLWAYQREGKKAGIYCNTTAESVVREKADELKPGSKKHFRSEVLDYIRIKNYIPREKIGLPKEEITVDNGILDLTAKELSEFNPKKHPIAKVPVKYDRNAQCSEIDKFLPEIFPENVIPMVEEMAGACLWKEYTWPKAFMLFGGGRNGKSTFLNLLTALIGSDNVSSKPLQGLMEKRFSRQALFGKLANIDDDLPSKRLEHTGVFKKLTGNDRIDAPLKHKNKSIKFWNYATLIFACNELPGTADRTTAFFERWGLIPLPNQFMPGDEKTDPNILDKLTTEKELSGFLNVAIDGLHRLLKQGHFTRTEERKKLRKRWIMQTDSLRSFVEEICREKTNNVITKEEFYNQYQNYCNENDIYVVKKNQVGLRLPSLAPYVKDGQKRIGDKKKTVWYNIAVQRSQNKLAESLREIYDEIIDKENDITLTQFVNETSTRLGEPAERIKLIAEDMDNDKNSDVFFQGDLYDQ